MENNHVEVSGSVASLFAFSHEFLDEKFYTFILNIERKSGVIDALPVIVSSRLIDVTKDYRGEYVHICGQFRSRNEMKEVGTRLLLFIFAREISLIKDAVFTNEIVLDGYICKKPQYRETPLGRKVADVLLAVNRAYDHSDYIPCLCWGRNASYMGTLGTGSHIRAKGRIQSRVYRKMVSDSEYEDRTAYEISIMQLAED